MSIHSETTCLFGESIHPEITMTMKNKCDNENKFINKIVHFKKQSDTTYIHTLKRCYNQHKTEYM